MSTRELLTGIAEDLDRLRVGVWHPDTPYTATDVGISLNGVPEDPPSLIAISDYIEQDIPTYRRDQESIVRYVQFFLRMPSKADGQDSQDVIRDRYHRRKIVLPNGVSATCRQVSRGPLGEDQNGRFLFSQNITFTILQART